jgi:hemoglobin
MKTDIRDKRDIELFVNSFYSKVRENELLAPVFASKIPDAAWPAHLQRMYDFWNAILFAETGFQGNPMQKHMRLPIEENHFNQWLVLFRQTIDELFLGPKAEEAKMRAESIAKIMNFKIASLHGRP